MIMPAIPAHIATWIVKLLCLVGGISPVLPWNTGGAGRYVRGFEIWYGGTFAGAFLLLLLYEVMTGGVRPRPLWQPVVTFFCSAALLVLFTTYGYALGHHWPQTAGPWLAVASVIALLTLSALQVRDYLAHEASRRVES